MAGRLGLPVVTNLPIESADPSTRNRGPCKARKRIPPQFLALFTNERKSIIDWHGMAESV